MGAAVPSEGGRFVHSLVFSPAPWGVAAADLVAQMVIEKKSVNEIDWKRNAVFCLFGAVYLGGFQFWYQVSVFRRFFPGVERFTSQPWADKLKDIPGLKMLAAQVGVNMTVLMGVYLPAFYIFKASVFSGVADPTVWVSQGLAGFKKNFEKDAYDLVRVWVPADTLCFSVPLYLRLPVRHVISFVWTAYLSYARGAK